MLPAFEKGSDLFDLAQSGNSTDASHMEADRESALPNNRRMPSPEKTLAQARTSQADANIRFSDLRRLLMRLGFSERIRGDHFIYTREGIDEIINLQPRGAKAKPYQVRQVRILIIKYELTLNNDE